ncbi:MAG: agmatine deiminase family protein [Myxococcota bacterium]
MKRSIIAILLLFAFSTTLYADEEKYIPPPKLPAYKTPSEKMKSGIRLYDFRSSNIELYRITQAPSVEVRSVAEFEPASILLLTYFPGYYDNVYRGIVTSTIDKVKIYFFYDTTSMKNSIISRLKGWGISQTQIDQNAVFVNTQVDSVWMRDSGPNPIVSADNKYGIVDFRYYPDRYYDDKIPTEFGRLLNLNVFRPSMDYEGGNFMTNGKGLCMATRGSIWENLPLKDSDIQKILSDYMGCKKTVFLRPLAGEGTTHIDMFAKFTSEDTILLAQYKFSQDCINYDILEENYNILLHTTTVDGKPLKIVRIPMADNSDGVWRTYTNSLLINNIALVPVYSKHKTYEAEALNAYRTALGLNWTIVPIDSEDIIPDGGSIHCITMTVPDFSLVKFQNDPDTLCGNSTNCNPSGCGSITTKGECDGDVVIWCENNSANFYDCASPCNTVPNNYPCEQRCEFNSSKGYYDCVSNFQCVQCVDECKMGESGCYDSKTIWSCAGDIDNDGCNEIQTSICENGKSCSNGICVGGCIADCTNKECGDDGCGGSCGSCNQNEFCGFDYKCHTNISDAGVDIDSDIKDSGITEDISDIQLSDITSDVGADIKDATTDITITDTASDILVNDTSVTDTFDTGYVDSSIPDINNTDAAISDTQSKDIARVDIITDYEGNQEEKYSDESTGCSCSTVE